MNHLIDSFGYWAVAFFVLAESFGLPLPGETAVIVAGIYAGHSHRLSPWILFLVAALAAVSGGFVGYCLGRVGGYRLVAKFGQRLHMDEHRFRIARYLFDTYGPAVVFFGRFVSILRTYAAFLAGTTKMDITRFSLANFASGVLWAAVYAWVSYVAGATLERISAPLDIVVGVVAVAVFVALALILRGRMEGLSARADAKYGAVE